MSRRLRGHPWPSLAISPYHSSPPAGLQGYNPCLIESKRPTPTLNGFKLLQRTSIGSSSDLGLLGCCPSSSSSCRAACADIPDRLSPLLPIIHRLRQVLRATTRVLTQLLYVSSCWSSHSCTSMCGGPQEYIAYELVLASPAVSCMSGSSSLAIPTAVIRSNSDCLLPSPHHKLNKSQIVYNRTQMHC